MPKSDLMPPEETSVKSLLLNRPLGQLTEDDIAQLTREDCRRYLKEKGMRRPSWNKSQAIQQVIMLKKLIEPEPNLAPASRKRLRISGSNYSRNSHSVSQVPQGMWLESENSPTAPNFRENMNRDDHLGSFFRHVAAVNDSASPSTPGTSSMLEGQMTIFYGGRVNVYNGVPPVKARAIIHVAATPIEISQEQHVDSSMVLQPRSHFSKVFTAKEHAGVLPPRQIAQMSDSSRVLGERSSMLCDSSCVLGDRSIMLCEQTPVEVQSSRKASVQKYLEKRRDKYLE